MPQLLEPGRKTRLPAFCPGQLASPEITRLGKSRLSSLSRLPGPFGGWGNPCHGVGGGGRAQGVQSGWRWISREGLDGPLHWLFHVGPREPWRQPGPKGLEKTWESSLAESLPHRGLHRAGQHHKNSQAQCTNTYFPPGLGESGTVGPERTGA